MQSFTEAAKYKSFSKAAKANNLTQPGMSKHIRNLEEDLNIILFHRTSGGIELTNAGEHLYNRIIPVIAELQTIRQEIQQKYRTAPIAIGCLPSLATYYLPSRIKEFQLMDKPITLIIQNTSNELIQSLQEGRVDAILIDSLNVNESLCSYELFTEPYHAVFPLNHTYQAKSEVKLSELCEQPLIVHQAPCDTRMHIIKQIELLGYKPNIISELSFGDFIFGSVIAGMGITIVPEIMAKNISHLDLFTLPIIDFGRKRTVSLVTQSNKLGSKLFNYITQFD
ncbi:LysR family transcriptional regulator [Bacillus sp. JJ722]|uniref:LysR family transcriptional regulator n=1 Tax=Bacillus sp. JJ722 TaxID=3122973 RepID=UPI002FFEF0A2